MCASGVIKGQTTGSTPADCSSNSQQWAHGIYTCLNYEVYTQQTGKGYWTSFPMLLISCFSKCVPFSARNKFLSCFQISHSQGSLVKASISLALTEELPCCSSVARGKWPQTDEKPCQSLPGNEVITDMFAGYYGRYVNRGGNAYAIEHRKTSSKNALKTEKVSSISVNSANTLTARSHRGLLSRQPHWIQWNSLLSVGGL